MSRRRVVRASLRVAAAAFAGLGVTTWLVTAPGPDEVASGVVALATGLVVSAFVSWGIGYTLRGAR